MTHRLLLQEVQSRPARRPAAAGRGRPARATARQPSPARRRPACRRLFQARHARRAAAWRGTAAARGGAGGAKAQRNAATQHTRFRRTTPTTRAWRPRRRDRGAPAADAQRVTCSSRTERGASRFYFAAPSQPNRVALLPSAVAGRRRVPARRCVVQLPARAPAATCCAPGACASCRAPSVASPPRRAAARGRLAPHAALTPRLVRPCAPQALSARDRARLTDSPGHLLGLGRPLAARMMARLFGKPAPAARVAAPVAAAPRRGANDSLAALEQNREARLQPFRPPRGVPAGRAAPRARARTPAAASRPQPPRAPAATPPGVRCPLFLGLQRLIGFVFLTPPFTASGAARAGAAHRQA